jgi:hypothetical protein
MGVTHDRKRLNTGGNQGRLCSLYAVLNAIADCLGASPVHAILMLLELLILAPILLKSWS